MLGKGVSWERPYLFATIRNRFIDACRRRQTLRFVSLEDDGDANVETFRNFDSPEAFDCFESRLLHEALGTLRPDERETLFLAVVEGYTAEEIARLSDRPRGTVLSLIFRAKRKLRARLSAIPHAVRAGAVA